MTSADGGFGAPMIGLKNAFIDGDRVENDIISANDDKSDFFSDNGRKNVGYKFERRMVGTIESTIENDVAHHGSVGEVEVLS